MRHGTLFLAVAAAALMSAGASAAATLWNQPRDGGTSGVINQGAPGGTFDYAYAVADVVFSTDVVIDTIETLNFNNGGYVFPTSVDAVVNVFDSDPLSSTSDPATGGDLGQLTTAALAQSGGDVTLTASGLGIALSAGTYWIGLTPILDWESGSARLNTYQAGPTGASDILFFGPEFGGPNVSSFTGAGLSFADANIRIDGTAVSAPIPLPAALPMLLAGLGGLVLLRRRG
jgi:hypothetical protein